MLLEMTKQVSDSTVSAIEQNTSFVTAKVSKALESALSDLATQTPQEMQRLAVNPQFKMALVSQVAQELRLNVPQQQQLEQLVDLAMQRLVSPKVLSTQEQGNVISQATSVLNSGPQGGTTGTSAVSETNNTQAKQFLAQKDPGKDSMLESTFAAAAVTAPVSIVNLASQLAAPELVSTRTQGISSENALPFDPLSKGQSVQASKQLVLTTQASAPSETGSTEPTSQITGTVQATQSLEPALVSFAPAPQSQRQMVSAPDAPRGTEHVQPSAIPVAVALPDDNNAPTNDPVKTTNASASQSQASVTTASKAQTPEKSAPQPGTVRTAAPEGELPFQVELLPTQSQPEIVHGSEVVLGQPLQQEAISSQASTPIAGNPQTSPQGEPQVQPTTVALPAANAAPALAATPIQTPGSLFMPQFQVAQDSVAQPILAVPVPTTQQVVMQVAPSTAQPLTFENAQTIPAVSESADAAGKPTSISPLKRWLSETMLADSNPAMNTAAAPSAPTLNSDTVKDFAATVAREFGLRQTVFTQALSALENAGSGSNQLRIRLKPESLGSLDVTLTVEGGKLTARIVASNTEVRDVFAGNLQLFKQSLEAQGLQVNQLSVAVRAETGAQGQPGQQQPPQQLFQRSMLQDTQGSVAAMSALFASIGADPSLQRFSALA
jgi:flagellar hook-length control protein FliK